MNDYFNHVIRQLHVEDMALLQTLEDQKATVAFRAMKRGDIAKALNFTEANFRKTVGKLQAIHFIETAAGGKEQRFFLTNFGQRAIAESLIEEL